MFATEPRAVGFTIVWPDWGAEASFEQEFNSLDAQREACAAYVASHKKTPPTSSSTSSILAEG